jgi:nicotinamide mononucleotide transporter
MQFFQITNTFFSFSGYQVSYLEFCGLVTGLIAISLSARANVWNWPIGILNVILSFFLFYQVQLYPDMLLQMFFLVTNLIGWWRWSHPGKGEEDKRHQLKVTFLDTKGKITIAAITIIGTLLVGKFASRLHDISPFIFNKPSAFPYLDSFILVTSIVTTFYMIQKKIESWIVWIVVDLTATYLYFQRGIILYSVLYLVFCFIAAYGLFHWTKEYRSYQDKEIRN